VISQAEESDWRGTRENSSPLLGAVFIVIPRFRDELERSRVLQSKVFRRPELSSVRRCWVTLG
jgi:hypothetical protein